MIVHLHQIPPEGLHLEGEEDAAFLDLHEEAVKPAGPVRHALDVGLSAGGLFATGTLSLELDLECVTCLARFRYPLEVRNFALQTELGGAETVDLTPQVREDILLALPPYPHCDWDGQRVCHGATRAAKTTENEPGASHTWDALDQLKLK